VQEIAHRHQSTRALTTAKLPAVTRDEWISEFARRAGADGPSVQEVRELLDLAGTAAHASERTAAPLACWIAGRTGTPLPTLLEIAAQIGDPPASAD
jgi:hypothetical protein